MALRPLGGFGVHGQRSGGIGNMIIGMSVRIDIKREREVSIPLQTRTLVVAFKRLSIIALVGLGSETFGLLLEVLARARDERFTLARLILLTR